MADQPAPELPLEGLTVLDVSSFIAAPAAAVVLGDYGADVIKVEPPGAGDPHRLNINLPHIPSATTNYPWHLDNRNKRSIALDLKMPEARRALDRLIVRADILITNYPFPVRERLRLRPEDVVPLNPRLIYASFTGYGETGPDKDLPGFDSNAYFARSGIVESGRYEGQPPAFSLPAQGDRASAMGFLSAILLALYRRERTGRGGQVASSLFANGLWSNGILAQAALVGQSLGLRPPRGKPRSALSNIYETRDARWMQLTIVREDKMWSELCKAIGRPSLQSDPRFAETAVRRQNAEALTALLDDVFRSRDWAEWHAVLSAHQITHAPVARVQEVGEDRQAAEAGMIIPTDISDMPRTIAAPFRLGGVEPCRPQPAPELGADTDGILSEAGFCSEEIAALRRIGAAA